MRNKGGRITLDTPAKRGKGNKARVPDEPLTPAECQATMTWAQRLKHVFGIDIETCPACAGAVQVIACIEDPVVIKRILDHLKQKAEVNEPSPLPESRAPPTSAQGRVYSAFPRQPSPRKRPQMVP